MSKKIFVTAALPYVNGRPHAGNLIGSTLSGDIYTRCERKLGNEVLYICGTDDYGSQTEHKALSEKMSCEELCDKYRVYHKQVYDWFNIEFDEFGKTPTETHTQITQEVMLKLYQNEMLEEKESEQYYCECCDRFLCDRFIHGICCIENCGGLIKGDECDKCCKIINIDEVEKKWCSICKTEPIKKSTTHLYLNLGKYKDELNEYFLNNENKKGVKYMSVAAKRVTKEWLSKDLTERCVTRDLKWGVKLPTFEGLNGYDNKVTWPWLDAPLGYISITANKYKETWREWINENVDWVQFMAKDNVPFHSIIFPSTLIASGYEKLNCGVTHLVASEYLLYNGEKFSKSNGVGIFGDQIIEISEKLGIDEDYWRYYLLRIRPETTDSTFTYEGFCNAIKGELAQKMGNLVNRAIHLVNKLYEKEDEIVYSISNTELQTQLMTCVENYIKAIEGFHFHQITNVINKVAEIGNEWINMNKLWETCKIKPKESEYLMGNLLMIIWIFAELSEPVMPKKSKTIKQYFVENSIDENMVIMNKIIEIIHNGNGIIKINKTNMKNPNQLFKQIKMEEISELCNL